MKIREIDKNLIAEAALSAKDTYDKHGCSAGDGFICGFSKAVSVLCDCPEDNLIDVMCFEVRKIEYREDREDKLWQEYGKIIDWLEGGVGFFTNKHGLRCAVYEEDSNKSHGFESYGLRIDGHGTVASQIGLGSAMKMADAYRGDTHYCKEQGLSAVIRVKGRWRVFPHGGEGRSCAAICCPYCGEKLEGEE